MAGAGFKSPYHAYHQDTVDAIANLATATASDHASVAPLTVTNSNFSSGLAATNVTLVSALQEITKLTSLLFALQHTYISISTRSDPNHHYCWTNGY